MNRIHVREAVGILSGVAKELGASVRDASSIAAADLRQSIGLLTGQAETLIVEARFGSVLAEAFGAAQTAGASFDSMDRVRAVAVAADPTYVPGVIVASAAVQMSLATMAGIIADMVFTSRSEVESIRSRIDKALTEAEEDAADDGDSQSYRSLTFLHAATIRDLAARARPLPQMITYRLVRSLPALTIANRLYGDGGRFDEIYAENKSGYPHPLFMPSTGRALSR